MTVRHGIWEVSEGKGGRIYIKCICKSKLGHADLASSHGLLIYGWAYTQDLAVALLKFEEERNKTEGILQRLKNGDYEETEIDEEYKEEE